MRNSQLLLCFLGLFLFFYRCELNPYKHGAIMYTNFCATCHMETGEGLRSLIPPLAQSDYLRDHQERLACIIRYGIQDTIVVNGKTYDQPMLGIPQLTEAEITNIINYINQAWGNEYGVITLPQVNDALAKCK